MTDIQISGLNPISELDVNCQIATDDSSAVTWKFSLTQLNNFLSNYFADISINGTVTSITAGIGLVGGDITTTGTIDLDSTLPANLTIPEPMIDEILDANANIILKLVPTPTAVNYVAAINQVSGAAPGFDVAGTDTNISMGFNAKGTGQIEFSSGNTTVPWVIFSGTGLQHTTQFAFANTAATRTVTFQDSDGTVAYLSDVSGVYLPLAGGTMAGTLNMGTQTLTGLPNPINPTDAVNLQTLNLGLQGLNPVESVQASSTANLTVTYNNGTSGVGATLTNAGTQAALVLDGYTAQVNDRILIPNQSSTFQNGIYVVTNIGSPSTNWILTRASDNNSPTNMLKGNLVGIVNGTTLKGTSTAQSSTVTTVGTSAVTYTIIFSPQTYAGATSINTVGTITSGAWNASNIPLANGGTNASLTAANGAIPYSTASAMAFLAPTGTAGLALLSGSSSAPIWSASPPITQINTYVIGSTGAFSYVPTTGTRYTIFELQGAGGGSGGTTGAASQSAASGAGAGGNYLRLFVMGAANLAAITGSVGVGGTAGTSGNNAGGTGGNTTLTINGGTQWVAAGGLGGGGQTSSATAQVSGAAGSIGTSVGGTNAALTTNIAGQNGSMGYSNGAITTSGWLNAIGGGTFFANPGRLVVSSTGTPGQFFGGGASGSINASGSNQAGAVGGQGIVQVMEFISA